MRNASQHEDCTDDGEPGARLSGHFDGGHEDQHEGRAFHEIELGAHAARQQVVTAVTEKDLIAHAQLTDTCYVPESDDGRCRRKAQRGLKNHGFVFPFVDFAFLLRGRTGCNW